MILTRAALPRRSTLGCAAVVGLALVANAAGVLDGPGLGIAACFAIMVLGLPHGTLDLELLKRRRAAPGGATAALALYLGCAGVMALIWLVHPVAALASFLSVAVVHFAEDWDDAGSRFLATGLALALIAAPAIAHRPALEAIFVALTGSADAATVADILVVMAPVAIAVAVAAIVALATDGHADTALAATGSLAALLVLPPVIGFALFFCLFHSPRHFRAALRDLAWPRVGQWAPVVVPLTLAAIGIVAVLYVAAPPTETAMRAVAATFTALSILTVPHMLVPSILDRIDTYHSRPLKQNPPAPEI